jgi:hypothetical protein
MKIKEKALQFGPGRQLFGLLSLPEKLDPERPAILIPNTGFEHRAGPHRLHVHLCRAFARLGFAALRFDLSGMGDSGVARGAQSDPIADQRAAMDELERLGIARTCIPIGLCSGGHDAHRYAKAEPRAVAAGFLDHYLYHTRRSRWLSLRQRLSEPRRFVNFFQRKLGALRGEGGVDLRGEEYFEQPELRVFRQDLRGFMRRRLPLFFLFTGEYQTVYNYPEQLLDVCPELSDYDLYDLHYFAESDHTFSQAQMRDQLIDSLERWLLQQVLPQLARQRRNTVTPLRPSAPAAAAGEEALNPPPVANDGARTAAVPQYMAAIGAAVLIGAAVNH